MKRLCFVLMPFGVKPDRGGGVIDFDAVFKELIAPAIVAAGLEPIRADEEVAGGIIHKPMFERLVLCEFAVADLTTANANVFYELGVRHAVLPETTVLLHAGDCRLPFDVAPLRTLPYQLDCDGSPKDVGASLVVLKNLLVTAQQSRVHDSPVFQLLEGYPDIKRLKTDVFRERVAISATVKEQLAQARSQGLEAIHAVETGLDDIAKADAGVVVDLFLSYRAVKGWAQMIALVDKMSVPVAQTVLVQEQLALALNRNGEGEQAERRLMELIEKRGPSSETYGILGRVLKDRWETALKAGQELRARGGAR